MSYIQWGSYRGQHGIDCRCHNVQQRTYVLLFGMLHWQMGGITYMAHCGPCSMYCIATFCYVTSGELKHNLMASSPM